MQNRLKIIRLFFGVYILCLLARLFFWQIWEGDKLAAQARTQYQSQRKILAPRGNILASDGTWLAATRQAWDLSAYLPQIKKDKSEIAKLLAPILLKQDKTEEDTEKQSLRELRRVETLIRKTDASWVPLKSKISSDLRKEIVGLDIEGLGFDINEARVYPEGSSSAHLLGFVGQDDEGNDKGYFGLEGEYDLSLSGRHGIVDRESDARGTPILLGNSKEISAINGVDLVTHIDKTIQMIIEQKLNKAIEDYGAKSGQVIIMNPKDGGVLGMASYPSYHPGSYYDYSDELFKNPVISDAFEPGSIFKPIVMASGLDAGVIKPDTLCDICGSPVKVDKYVINTWDNKYHPDETMTDVIIHSDNVGMVFVGQKLGQERFVDYLQKFGFDSPTNIDLQGEANPRFRKKGDWNIVDLATGTFGQGIAVTPIQMIRAVAAIANDGVMITPQVVDKIKGDGWQQDIKPELGSQVISKKAAEDITYMMSLAVKEGEAKWAVPKGFKIAGKTGTAQIPVAGHYDSEKTIASFVGFAPADDPKFIMLVSLREPKTSQWGSETAAPLWFNIARDLFPYMGIQPEN